MKFSNVMEREAFEFIIKIASDCLSNNGCNDLEKSEEKFRHLLIRSQDDDGKCMREVCYDFDILQWLQEQIEE